MDKVNVWPHLLAIERLTDPEILRSQVVLEHLLVDGFVVYDQDMDIHLTVYLLPLQLFFRFREVDRGGLDAGDGL